MTVPNQVTSGLIDFINAPPLGLLAAHLDFFGPYSGNVTVSQWSRTPGPIFETIDVSNSFGVLWQLNGPIPTHWSFTTGWVSDDGQNDESTYRPRLAQLNVQHQLLSGGWVTTQRVEVNSFPGFMRWDEALPGRLGLLVAPHIALDLFFLLIN